MLIQDKNFKERGIKEESTQNYNTGISQNSFENNSDDLIYESYID